MLEKIKAKSTERIQRFRDTSIKEKLKSIKWTPEKILMAANTVVVVGIMVFYLGRMVHFKDLLDKQYRSTQDISVTSLTEGIINVFRGDERLVDDGNGGYYFTGKPEKNFVLYSNQLYRIMGITSDGCIRLVAENGVTSSVMYEDGGYTATSLYKWLDGEEEHEGIFRSSLTDSANFTALSTVCVDPVDDLSSLITQEEPEEKSSKKKANKKNKDEEPEEAAGTFEEVQTALPGLKEYILSGGKKGYMQNGRGFWLSDVNSKGEHWYVNADGDVGVNSSKVQMNEVRPVITLSYSVVATGGSGTAEDPYVLTPMEEISQVSQAEVGEYIAFGGYTWRVSEMTDDGDAILLMDGYVISKDEKYSTSFGSKNTFTTDSGLGKYLNGTFLKSLENYDKYLKQHAWNYGTIEERVDYSYKNNYEGTYKCYVSVPNTSFFFINEYPDIFFNTLASTTDKLIFTMSESGMLYADVLSGKHFVRPAVCLSGAVNVTAGIGAQEDPFILEVIE